MPKVHAPEDVRELAKPILKIFKDTPDLKIIVDKKVLTSVDLIALDAAVESADSDVDAKRVELVPLLNARNERAARLHAVLVQARKAVAGYFGEDSDEYELVGGTRKSERRRPGPRTARVTTAPKAQAAG